MTISGGIGGKRISQISDSGNDMASALAASNNFSARSFSASCLNVFPFFGQLPGRFMAYSIIILDVMLCIYIYVVIYTSYLVYHELYKYT